MKLCVKCRHAFQSHTWRCPKCGYEPGCLEGYRAYAPELAEQNSGYNKNFYAELTALEDENFWFRARNSLILWAIKRYCTKIEKFCEIGCGTGYVLRAIANNFPDLQIVGTEIYITGLKHVQERVSDAELMQMDARHIPYQDEFQGIGAFDVIEHIQEDQQVINRIFTSLCKNGYLIVTVPQHPSLWSMQDEAACHVRRYTRKELLTKLENAGFVVERTTSFVFFLLPAMYISRRLMSKATNQDAISELRINPVINQLFYYVLRMEEWLIKIGASFPVGGSLLVIARKP